MRRRIFYSHPARRTTARARSLDAEQRRPGGVGHYELVPNWPQPLPGPENAGWTWGSTGGVYPSPRTGSGSGCAGSCRRRIRRTQASLTASSRAERQRREGQDWRWDQPGHRRGPRRQAVQSWKQHDPLLAKGGKGPHKIKMVLTILKKMLGRSGMPAMQS